jgi:hypothetical protein
MRTAVAARGAGRVGTAVGCAAARKVHGRLPVLGLHPVAHSPRRSSGDAGRQAKRQANYSECCMRNGMFVQSLSCDMTLGTLPCSFFTTAARHW